MNITTIPLPKTPFLDPRTGLMAREWYRFFLNLFSLTGGGTNDLSISDLAVSPVGVDASTLQTAQMSYLMAAYDSLVQAALVAPVPLQSSAQDDPTAFGRPAWPLDAPGWFAWTPSRTGWTDVGSPTVTAFFLRYGSVCFFAVKVIPGTTVATVAGTSYIDLPVAPRTSALNGDANMEILTTLIAVGTCAFDLANSRCYVPAQTATGNTLQIAGWYPI